ncbi:MAG: hypothetical protein JWM93_3104 [Frankiales bacterium]|nr:hypothetical protein [Frankiales bacterium]
MADESGHNVRDGQRTPMIAALVVAACVAAVISATFLVRTRHSAGPAPAQPLPSAARSQTAKTSPTTSPTTTPTRVAAAQLCGSAAVGDSGPPTVDVGSAIRDHCLVRVLTIDTVATFSPLSSAPPEGSLSSAVALLGTADEHFFGKSWHVQKLLAGYANVRVTGALPGVAAAGYESVPAWVLAWKLGPEPVPCPYPGEEAQASFEALPPLGALADWRFLVVPTDGHVPLSINPTRDFCSHRYDAEALPVFRHEHPVVSSKGDYEAYECGQRGYSGDASTGAVDLVVGVPVDTTVCARSTQHLEGYTPGVTKLEPPGEVSGWPAGLAKP